MGKNVAVFVDVANIFYAAKAAGVDIDYVTLLKSATAGRDFVRAYAYTGLDPDNENQRNFHQFLARHSYKVVSKDIRKYGDGKVKANLDIELVVDMMKTARNLDVAVVVSGDGDFAPAIRAVQEMGVRVEVISFRGNTSSDLIEVADLFTDIAHIAKVDKSSTRSGRRVADDDEDLSMTEVPDKMTEGTGRGRGRGRGRSEREGGYSSGSRGGRPSSGRDYGRDSGRDPERERVTAPAGSSSSGLVALPGEKLSRAASAAAAPVEDEELEEGLEVAAGEEPQGEGEGEGHRRRRRRGGRGRGRGRRDELAVDGVEPVEGAVVDEAADGAAAAEGEETEETEETDEAEAADEAIAAAPRPERTARGGRSRTPSGELPTPFDDLDALAAAPRAPKSTPFGSVWGRQPGTPATRPAAGLAPLPDDEDLEEPAIPEYLLTEQRRGQGGRGQVGGGARGGRGGGVRSAYAAAIDRERYGGGRGGGTSRFTEPARGGRSGGGGAQGAQGGRGGQQPSRGTRPERQDRVDRAPRTGGAEWSEVPPELEQMLRAQMQRSRPVVTEPTPSVPVVEAPKRRTTRKPVAAAEAAAPVAEAAASPVAAPKRRT
ncbi:MAG: NYN domain-containing protein, partial [Chloroflexota bacterium]|nr:NYN domain-containing protein [Chloroflexota bacterium]